MPKFEKGKAESGDIEIQSSNGVSVVKWQDNREVLLCSNFISPIPTTTVKRRKSGSAEKLVIKCPAIVTEYNQYMGGVDLMDSSYDTKSVVRA